MEVVATKDSRSPREQLLDVLLVTLTADAARLAEIGAILSASELDMLARLRSNCCESETAADGARQ